MKRRMKRLWKQLSSLVQYVFCWWIMKCLQRFLGRKIRIWISYVWASRSAARHRLAMHYVNVRRSYFQRGRRRSICIGVTNMMMRRNGSATNIFQSRIQINYMGISSRPIMDRHAMCMSVLDRRSSCFFWYDNRRLRRFLIIKC